KGRVAILEVHTRDKPLAAGVELAQVARQTSGLTGAELANVCNEAAIHAGRRSDSYLSQADFDAALERVVAGLQQRKVLTEKERSMVFEWGMADSVSSRTLRADNYALSEETKRLRDSEQARLTDSAYAEAVRLLQKHRSSLDKLAAALLEKETLVREEVVDLLADVPVESRAADSVGVPRVVASQPQKNEG